MGLNKEETKVENKELDLEELEQVSGGVMRGNVKIDETKEIDESIKERIK